MHIVQPYAKIVNFMGLPPDCRGFLDKQRYDVVRTYGVEAVRFIEETGRTCYRSEGDQTADSYLKFIQKVVLESRHTQMLRFSMVVVNFLTDRGVAQEVTRHGATLTPQMESQRYCNYSKGKFGSSIAFVKPQGLTLTQDQVWTAAMETAEGYYFELLQEGCKAQIAADVLPRATACHLTMAGNFQAWRHFLLTRTTTACHPKLLNLTVEDQLREEESGALVDPIEFSGRDFAATVRPSLLRQFQAIFPLLFDDVEPLGNHVENMQKTR